MSDLPIDERQEAPPSPVPERQQSHSMLDSESQPAPSDSDPERGTSPGLPPDEVERMRKIAARASRQVTEGGAGSLDEQHVVAPDATPARTELVRASDTDEGSAHSVATPTADAPQIFVPGAAATRPVQAWGPGPLDSSIRASHRRIEQETKLADPTRYLGEGDVLPIDESAYRRQRVPELPLPEEAVRLVPYKSRIEPLREKLSYGEAVDYADTTYRALRFGGEAHEEEPRRRLRDVFRRRRDERSGDGPAPYPPEPDRAEQVPLRESILRVVQQPGAVEAALEAQEALLTDVALSSGERVGIKWPNAERSLQNAFRHDDPVAYSRDLLMTTRRFGGALTNFLNDTGSLDEDTHRVCEDFLVDLDEGVRRATFVHLVKQAGLAAMPHDESAQPWQGGPAGLSRRFRGITNRDTLPEHFGYRLDEDNTKRYRPWVLSNGEKTMYRKCGQLVTAEMQRAMAQATNENQVLAGLWVPEETSGDPIHHRDITAWIGRNIAPQGPLYRGNVDTFRQPRQGENKPHQRLAERQIEEEAKHLGRCIERAALVTPADGEKYSASLLALHEVGRILGVRPGGRHA